MVVVAAGRQEGRAAADLVDRVEAELLVPPCLGPVGIADPQMDVTDDAVFRRALPAGVAIRHRGDEVRDVEPQRRHLDRRAVPFPALVRTIGIDFDAIAFRVGEVERLADQVIRGAVDGNLPVDGVPDPAAEIGARGQQERGVEKAGRTRVVRPGGGIGLDHQQRPARRAERDRTIGPRQLLQPDDGAVVARRAFRRRVP